jgi:hypothetical protein
VTMEPASFALHLESFIMEAKKLDGGQYKNNSMKVLISGIFRWRRSNTKLENDQFENSDYVKAQKILRSRNVQGLPKGLGKVRHAPLVGKTGILGMLQHSICNPDTPQGLLYRLIVLVSRHAMGRANELWTVLREDVLKLVDDKGKEYYQIVLRETKTRKGTDAGQTWTFRENKNVKYCPVYWLSFYLARAPSSSRLLQRPLSKAVPNWKKEKIWYSKQVIGKNKLRKMFGGLGNVIGVAGLTGHSFRRAGVQSLQEAGVPEQIIAKKVGHSNVQHLAPYCEVSEKLDEICHDTLAINSQPDSSSTGEEPQQTACTSSPCAQVETPLQILATACSAKSSDSNNMTRISERVSVTANDAQTPVFAHCTFTSCSFIVNVKPN